MRIYYCPICQEEFTDKNYRGEKLCKECKKHLKEIKKDEEER